MQLWKISGQVWIPSYHLQKWQWPGLSALVNFVLFIRLSQNIVTQNLTVRPHIFATDPRLSEDIELDVS